jgi:hypothetical protein
MVIFLRAITGLSETSLSIILMGINRSIQMLPDTKPETR